MNNIKSCQQCVVEAASAVTSSCFVPLPIFLTAKHRPSSLAPASWGKANCLHGLAYCLGSLVMGNPNLSLLYIFRGKSVSLCSCQHLLLAFEGCPHPSTARLRWPDYLLLGLSGSRPTVLRIRDCTPHCSCAGVLGGRARKSRGAQSVRGRGQVVNPVS